MIDKDILELFDQDIYSAYLDLTGIYKKTNGYKSDFDQLPTPAKVALFDMVFNLGAPKLKSQFIKLNLAIKNENWDVAAIESYRFQLSAERNEEVADLFRQSSGFKR